MLRLLVEVFAVTLIQTLTMLSLLMQWLPSIIRTVFDVMRLFMAVSCSLYRGLANWVSPVFAELGIPINAQPWRTVFAMLISIGIGAAACTATGLMLTAWILAGMCMHGLAVGLVWNHLALPDGQSIGR